MSECYVMCESRDRPSLIKPPRCCRPCITEASHDDLSTLKKSHGTSGAHCCSHVDVWGVVTPRSHRHTLQTDRGIHVISKHRAKVNRACQVVGLEQKATKNETTIAWHPCVAIYIAPVAL